MRLFAMANPGGHLRTLFNDRNLRRFLVQARSTGNQLGIGSYGAVEEVEVHGLVCAGKKIHEILLDVENIGVRDIAAKYVQECQLMADLRHPNIIQFLGLCFLPDCQLPLLVMEKLEGSLDNLLETVPNILFTLKCSMLEDVARGLLYLHNHNPQIIHRDLTAKNVLLTSSLVAKITDLGNSRIVNIQPGQLAQTLSRNPGTAVYMPPEALTAAARYGPSLDIFSFGHLGIFVGIQIFPGDLLEPTYDDPDNRGSLLARSEVERRGQYIERLDCQLPKSDPNRQHPFVELVKRCLKNNPSDRPTAEEVITSLEEMKADIEGPYGEVARADAVRQVVIMRALKKRETEVRRKTDESAAKDEVIHQLQQELEHEQTHRSRTEEQLQRVNTQLHQQITELEHTTMLLQQKDMQIEQKDRQIIESAAELEAIRTEVNSFQQVVTDLSADLADKEAQLRVQEEEMKQRDAEINRLTELLKDFQAQLPLEQQTPNRELESLQWPKTQQIKRTPLADLNRNISAIQWRRGKRMPYTMSGSVQIVAIRGSLYVGGGYNRGKGETVMVYSLSTESWRTLSPYASQWFGMAAVNGQLVLVGGRNLSTDATTNVLGVWDEGSQTWTHSLPGMPTPRDLTSVISYRNWLIVAGGGDVTNCYVSKVELLDTLSRQWYEGSPLPNKCSAMSSAICGNMWYLSRGYCSPSQPNKHVFSVCLDELISQVISQSAGPMSSSAPSPWQILPDTPTIHSTVITFGGGLLAIGGWVSSDIHTYQSSSKKWVKFGDMPESRSQFACIVLPNEEIFIAGGISSGFDTDDVTIAAVISNN